MSLKHTWSMPLLALIVLVGAYYISPGEHNPLYPALHLSYANPALHERTNTLPAHIGNPTQYGKGRKDFAFVAFYTIVFTFTREFCMQRLIRPLAIRAGIKSRGKQARFMEQAYTAMYFAVFGPFGLWVMSRTPVWYFNTAGMYQGFPHRAHEACFKTYYLLQAAYWAQQAIVLMLQLEKPRKDFKELVLHHIITLALIGLSYRFHFTYMGIAVYITHDISDFFLAVSNLSVLRPNSTRKLTIIPHQTSKILNYLDSSLTIPYFITFIGVWSYLRHFLNLKILYSLLPGGKFATVGPYVLNWETQQYKCWISQSITFGLLALLQMVNIFWIFLILRILYRALFSDVVKDERSDDETEVEEVDEKEGVEAKSNGQAKPSLMLNGEEFSPVDSQAPATGLEVRGGEDVIKRKR
jgi:acyl-CoA-dependent ceramide synthase